MAYHRPRREPKFVAAYSIDVTPNGSIGVLTVMPSESDVDEPMREDEEGETIHIFDVHSMREPQVIQSGHSGGDDNEASAVKINPSGCSLAVWQADRGCILIYSSAWYNDKFELWPKAAPWKIRETLHWLDNNTLQ